MGSGSSAQHDIRLNTELDSEQRSRFQNSHTVQRLLREAKVVAVVGMSTEKTKPSNMVAWYLRDEGFRVIPVNPRAKEIDGLLCYPDLASVPEPVDIVDIFRPSGEVAGIVEQAIAAHAKAVWMQLRIVDLDAAERALQAGLDVVVDRCIKMEHGRYGGALHWAGMNTEVVTAQRRRR